MTTLMSTASPRAGGLAGRRTPFGWPTVTVTQDQPGRLCSTSDAQGRAAWLRLVVAMEVWETTSLRVSTARSGLPLGRLEMDFSDAFEIVELPLSAAEVRCVEDEGVTLETDAADSIIIFDGRAPVPEELRPRLRRRESGRPVEAALDALRSYRALQQFGWKEGCVLDGMRSLERALPGAGFSDAVTRHLELFVTPDRGFTYEDPWGRPVDGLIHGIEGALPFAIIADRNPDDPLIDRFLDHVDDIVADSGVVADHAQLSAEGNYTIAYPLAVIARQRRRPELVRIALTQLAIRTDALVDGADLYLRSEPDGRTFRNWARAYAWYLLGAAKTLEQVHPKDWPDGIVEAFAQVAAHALRLQLPDGLWRAFLDDTSTGVDTSGSAGIAAGLAIGTRIGLYDAGRAPLDAQGGLLAYLTDDGLLAGSTQANKDGERLQRRDYRIISQMGTGLFGQLHAEVGV